MFPGVPRETEEEKEVADFDIFDDPETPYSTFNFQYSNEAYMRLHDLMEFNTLNNLEVSWDVYSGYKCATKTYIVQHILWQFF